MNKATMKATTFDATVPNDVLGMRQAVIAAGGRRDGRNTYIVEFDDGSYWTAAVFRPDFMPSYYNGGPKIKGQF